MKKDGLQRMLDFLNYLREKKIHFYIEQYSSDELTVTLTLVESGSRSCFPWTT